VPVVSTLPVSAAGTVLMDPVGAIVSVRAGQPITAAADTVAVVVDGTPVSTHNGFAFDAAGRLVVTKVNPVASFHNGVALDAAGRLCVQTATSTSVHDGGTFDANGLLLVSGV
jgi:hypothetical protein